MVHAAASFPFSQHVVKFVRNTYTMASEEAERIGASLLRFRQSSCSAILLFISPHLCSQGVEHIAQVSQSSAQSSQVTVQSQGIYTALKMLLSRVLVIREFLVDVHEGQSVW